MTSVRTSNAGNATDRERQFMTWRGARRANQVRRGRTPAATATAAVTAPRMTDRSWIVGLALMLHAGGDNYADDPAPPSGGGARFASSVIEPAG